MGSVKSRHTFVTLGGIDHGNKTKQAQEQSVCHLIYLDNI